LQTVAKGICGRCYEEDVTLYRAPCQEKPEEMGMLGQYHCPDCGAMLMGGMPHFNLCIKCMEDIEMTGNYREETGKLSIEDLRNMRAPQFNQGHYEPSKKEVNEAMGGSLYANNSKGQLAAIFATYQRRVSNFNLEVDQAHSLLRGELYVALATINGKDRQIEMMRGELDAVYAALEKSGEALRAMCEVVGRVGGPSAINKPIVNGCDE